MSTIMARILSVQIYTIVATTNSMFPQIILRRRSDFFGVVHEADARPYLLRIFRQRTLRLPVLG